MDERELQQYSEWSKDLYGFVMDIMDYMKKPHDYGTGTVLNMVEMHTLAMIAENPGMTVGEVAKRWNRTMSAASRNVDRLCGKEYVRKQKEDGNEKNVHLYATETGMQLARFHRELDRRETERFAQYIADKCSREELEQFRAVMQWIRAFYLAERAGSIPKNRSRSDNRNDMNE